MMSKTWRHGHGKHGSGRTVVEERYPGGPIQLRTPDPTKAGGYRRRNLGFTIRDANGEIELNGELRAIEALNQYLKRTVPIPRAEDVDTSNLMMRDLLMLYDRRNRERTRAGLITTNSYKISQRQIAIWSNVLSKVRPTQVSEHHWTRFIRRRRTGEIDARGQRVPEKQRRPVGDRILEKDLSFLRRCFKWAVEQGYVARSPIAGLRLVKEKNPQRPMATQAQVAALLEAGRGRGYLPQLIVLANGTGRRINAIRQLKWEDVDLERTGAAPYGAIVWPDDTDKMSIRWRCPISAEVRATLDTLSGIGRKYVFPARANAEPIEYGHIRQWLHEAMTETGLTFPPLFGWHSFRRKWANDRKHLPAQDVAKAGGWKSLSVVTEIYQQADDETLLEVVTAAS